MKKHYILYCILLAGFTLGIYRGQLALWKDCQAEPLKIFPVYVDTLPPADQKRLESGISIESIQQLTQRLEDYLS